jgi:hypothetical protein
MRREKRGLGIKEIGGSRMERGQQLVDVDAERGGQPLVRIATQTKEVRSNSRCSLWKLFTKVHEILAHNPSVHIVQAFNRFIRLAKQLIFRCGMFIIRDYCPPIPGNIPRQAPHGAKETGMVNPCFELMTSHTSRRRTSARQLCS